MLVQKRRRRRMHFELQKAANQRIPFLQKTRSWIVTPQISSASGFKFGLVPFEVGNLSFPYDFRTKCRFRFAFWIPFSTENMSRDSHSEKLGQVLHLCFVIGHRRWQLWGKEIRMVHVGVSFEMRIKFYSTGGTPCDRKVIQVVCVGFELKSIWGSSFEETNQRNKLKDMNQFNAQFHEKHDIKRSFASTTPNIVSQILNVNEVLGSKWMSDFQ